MSDPKYIILRSASTLVPEAGSLGTRGSGTRGAPETLDIEEAELSRSERADLRRDPRTLAIAEPMPMKLLEPVETRDADPAATDVTWGVEAVRAPESPFAGEGIVVAVLDTGIDPDHPAFQGVELVQQNFTSGPDDDQHGHGTHCAGTIFGQDVGGLRIGVARAVSRGLIGKVLGPGGGSSATIARAIQWAVNEGAHVISMSLGIDFPGFVEYLVQSRGLAIPPATSMALEQYRANVNLFSALADAVRAQGAFGQGTVIVAASGNESERPSYEIAVAPPAAGTGVIAVGALQEGPDGLAVARFSNNQVDVSGPGVNVISARPGGGLTAMSGTSMATPHVAGVAALWAQKLLESSGRVESPVLMAQVVARGQVAPLAPGFEEQDVGTGIAQAPLG